MHSDADIIVELRESFDTATRSMSTSPELPAVIRQRLRRRRATRTMTVAVSVVAICVLVLTVSTLSGSHVAHTPTANGPSILPSRSPLATGPIRLVSVSQVLDAASAATAPVAGPGQYVHTRTTSYGMSQIVLRRIIDTFTTYSQDTWVPSDRTGMSFRRSSNNDSVDYLNAGDRDYLEHQAPGGPPAHDVSWYAATGTKPYEEIYPYPVSGGQGKTVSLPGQAAPTAWDDPTPQNLAGLPRDPDRLRASLYAHATTVAAEAGGAGKSYTADDAAFDAVSAVLSAADLSPDLRSVLYGVAKTIPGIKLIGSTANYGGAPGIAIGRVFEAAGVEHDLIFDENTGNFIGDRSVTVRATDQYSGTQGQPKLPAGTVLSATAISVDVTDKPVLPAGVKLP